MPLQHFGKFVGKEALDSAVHGRALLSKKNAKLVESTIGLFVNEMGQIISTLEKDLSPLLRQCTVETADLLFRKLSRILDADVIVAMNEFIACLLVLKMQSC